AVPRVPARHRTTGLVVLGAITGLYSGFLGLGGGFIVVPALVRWFGFDIKRAIGTSLVVVAILAVPGSITHYVLGNVDLALAALLALGVVPGALLGARLTSVAKERTVRIAFAILLLAVAALLGVTEVGLL
ncbi:MAG: sulfite exporter TauE/SafE family protein, partial [Coriobacteriia bacterium]